MPGLAIAGIEQQAHRAKLYIKAGARSQNPQMTQRRPPPMPIQSMPWASPTATHDFTMLIPGAPALNFKSDTAGTQPHAAIGPTTLTRIASGSSCRLNTTVGVGQPHRTDGIKSNQYYSPNHERSKYKTPPMTANKRNTASPV